MAADETYTGTIQTLVDRRSRLNAEMAALDAEIEALDRAIAILSSVGSTSLSAASTQLELKTRTRTRKGAIYSLISIRWACLWILSQAKKMGLSTAAITELLEKGGRTTKAGRFASTVSAVLSNMKIKREVEQVGNYWVLTPTGQAALTVILPRLQVLADEYLKYTEEDIRKMPESKRRELIDVNDEDYSAACEYYFGGANASNIAPI
jgi:hypothetical protein